ncbi:hypothetical protein [Streptomyces sp. NBC_01353]|uniref:hypothetical protein n=1 Tax=Streptomyces sp. NBC_01353 TaxID=2903835 RepID=UPI002E3734D0|nr:hypothetical protein [Streptomyces sp. NBC_01353]
MRSTTLPEPDPDTLTVRLPDGTLVLVARIDPHLPEEQSPLRRALRTARLLTPRD